MNQFSLVQAVDRFSEGVIVAVAPTADRRFDARFGEPLAIANADVLRTSVGSGVSAFRRRLVAARKRLFKRIRTKSVVIDVLTRQPTIRRANTSTTNATYSQPATSRRR